MRRRITAAVTLTAALLGAAALGVPAPAPASAEPTPSQFVTPYPVAAHDQRFDVRPNAEQTFRLDLPEMRRPRAVLAPCWGFDLTGPGVDVAAAGLKGFGWIADPDADWRVIQPTLAAGVELRDDGWYLPASRAVVDLDQMAQGAWCRAVGWSMFVSPTEGVASRAEVRRARRDHRIVRIARPRLPDAARARRANTYNDNAVRVTLAGTRFISPHDRGLQLVVRTVSGPLAGPTTITLHARVALQG
jgi:hypothetical protein